MPNAVPISGGSPPDTNPNPPPQYGQHTGQEPKPGQTQAQVPPAPAPINWAALTGGPGYTPPNPATGLYDPEAVSAWTQLTAQTPWWADSQEDWEYTYQHPKQALSVIDRLEAVEKWSAESLPAEMSLALAESWLDDKELQRAASILARRIDVPVEQLFPKVDIGGLDMFIDPRTGKPILSMREMRRLTKPYTERFFRTLLPTMDGDPLKIARTFRALSPVGAEFSGLEGLAIAQSLAESLDYTQVGIFQQNLRLMGDQEMSERDKVKWSHYAALGNWRFDPDPDSPNHYINWRLGLDISRLEQEVARLRAEADDSDAEDRDAIDAAVLRLELAKRARDAWLEGVAEAKQYLESGTKTVMGMAGPVQVHDRPEGFETGIALDYLSQGPDGLPSRYDAIIADVKEHVAQADADFKNTLLGKAMSGADWLFDAATQGINAGAYYAANIPYLAGTAIFDNEKLSERHGEIWANSRELLSGEYGLAERAMKDAPWLPPAAAYALEFAAQIALDPLNVVGKGVHVRKLFDLPILEGARTEMSSLRYFWNMPILRASYVGKNFRATFGARIRAAMQHKYLWLGRKTIPQFLLDAAFKYSDNYEDFWAYAVGKLHNVVGTDAISHEVASTIHNYARLVKNGSISRNAADQVDDVGKFLFAGIMPTKSDDLPVAVRELYEDITATKAEIALRPNKPKGAPPPLAAYEPFDYYGRPVPVIDDFAEAWVEQYRAFLQYGRGKMPAIPRPGGLVSGAFNEAKIIARHLQTGGSRYRRSTLATLMANIEVDFPDWVRNYMYRGKNLFSRQEVGEWVKEAVAISSPGSVNREREWVKYLERLQDNVVRRVAERYGLSPQQVSDLTKSMRAEARQLNNKLFGYAEDFDVNPEVLLQHPLNEAQLPNKWLMTDPVVVAEVVRDHLGFTQSVYKNFQRILRGAGDVPPARVHEVTAQLLAKTVTGRSQEVFLKWWKTATVMTLRYVLRVPLMDEQLRIIADVGGMAWLRMRKYVSRSLEAAGVHRPEIWNDILDPEFNLVIRENVLDAGFRDTDEVFDAIRLKQLGDETDELVLKLDRLNPYYRKYFEDTLLRRSRAKDPDVINPEWEDHFGQGAAAAHYETGTNTIYVDGEWMRAILGSEKDWQKFESALRMANPEMGADIHSGASFASKRILILQPGRREISDIDNLQDAKRIVFSGSRDWKDAKVIQRDIDALATDAVLVDGGAPGVDRIVHNYAAKRAAKGSPEPEQVLARWKKPDGSTDLSAGYRRNGEMLDTNPDLVIAYWDPASKGGSKGTLNTIAQAWDRGIPVLVRLPKGVSKDEFLDAAKAALEKAKRFNRPQAAAAKSARTTSSVKPQSGPTEVVNLKTDAAAKKALDAGDPDYVYIGRAGKGQQGTFGNPYKIGPDGTREEVIEKYRQWLERRVQADPAFAAKVKGLKGKKLVCFDAPAACHGDVLKEMADRLAMRENGVIGKFRGDDFFLSNFSESPVRYLDEDYPTAEHAFQAAKSGNKRLRAKIAKAATPAEAKKLGRTVPLRKDWETVKVKVMEDILRAKFSEPGLRAKLLATGEKYLEEGFVGDAFWGVIDGKGRNELGKLLMRIREDFRKADEIRAAAQARAARHTAAVEAIQKKMNSVLRYGHQAPDPMLVNEIAFAIDDAVPAWLMSQGFDPATASEIAAQLKGQMFRAIKNEENLDAHWFEVFDRRGFRRYDRTSRADSIEGTGKTPNEYFGVTTVDEEGNVLERVEGNKAELRRYYRERERAKNVALEESEAVPGYPTLDMTINEFLAKLKEQLFHQLRARKRPDFVPPPSTRTKAAVTKYIRDLSQFKDQGELEKWDEFIALVKKNLGDHPDAEYIVKRLQDDPVKVIIDLNSGVLGYDAERAIIAASKGKNGKLIGTYIPRGAESGRKPWWEVIYGESAFKTRESPSFTDPLRGDIHTQLFDPSEAAVPGSHRGYWFFDAIIEQYKKAHPEAPLGPSTQLIEGLGMAVDDKAALKGVTINHEMGHAILEKAPPHIYDELMDMFQSKRVLESDAVPEPETYQELLDSISREKAYDDELHELFSDAYAAWKYDPEVLKDFDEDLYKWMEAHKEYFDKVVSEQTPQVKYVFKDQTPDHLTQRIQQPHYGELEDEVAVNSGRSRDAFVSRENEVQTFARRMTKNVDMNARFFGEVKPGEPHYMSTLTEVLTNQHGRSELSRRILVGIASNRTDEEIMDDMLEWFKTDIGRGIARRLMLGNKGDQEERIELLTEMLRGQTFDDAGIAEAVLTNNPHLNKMLRKAWDQDPGAAIPVNGYTAAELGGRPHPGAVFVEWLGKWIFEMPTNKLSRQPYFKYWFTHMKEGLTKAAIDEGLTITPDLGRQIETSARSFAIERTNKVLFDFRKQNRWAEMLGFVTPFFQPWKEAFQVWGHLLRKNPGFAARVRVVMQELEEVLTDEDPITGEKRLALSNMWFAAPVLNMFFGKGGINGIQGFPGSFSLSAPLGSFNFLFGSTFEVPTGNIAGNFPIPVPSLNPLLMFAAQKLADSDLIPDDLKLSFTRWAYQYGSISSAEGFMGGLLPTWVQHTLRGFNPEWLGGENIVNSQATDFLRMYEAQGLTPQSIMKMSVAERDKMFGEVVDYDEEGNPVGDGTHAIRNTRDAEVYLSQKAYNSAKSLQYFRAFFSFAMPAAPSIKFPTAELEAEYRDLVEEVGWDEARDEFLKRHPQHALITIPTTYWERADDNIVPIPANALADALMKQPDFAEFAKANPMWAFALLPTEAWEGDFDRAVFFQQMDEGLRSTRTPLQMYEALDREEGWALWRDVRAARDQDEEKLAVLGVPATDPLMDDIAAGYEDAINDIIDKYPGFAMDYGQFEKYNLNPWVELHARAALESDLFRATDVGKGLIAYQTLRQDVIKAMRENGISSLETSSAERYGITKMYDQGVARIVKNHPDFERAYNYLFSDDLRNVETAGQRLLEGLPKGWEKDYTADMQPFWDAREVTRTSSNPGDVAAAYTTMRDLSNGWMQTYGWNERNPQYIWWNTMSRYEQENYKESVALRPYLYLSTFEREVILGEHTYDFTEGRIQTVSETDAIIAQVRAANPFAQTGDMYESRDRLVRQFMQEDPNFRQWVNKVNTWGYGFFEVMKLDELPGREGQAWDTLRIQLAEAQRRIEVNEWHGDSDYNPLNRDLYDNERFKLLTLVENLKDYSKGFEATWIRLEEHSPGPYLISDFIPDTWFRYGG